MAVAGSVAGSAKVSMVMSELERIFLFGQTKAFYK
jgi:hypothetical protein